MRFELSDNVRQRVKEKHLEHGLSLLFPPVQLKNGKRLVCEPPSPPGTRPDTQHACVGPLGCYRSLLGETLRL